MNLWEGVDARAEALQFADLWGIEGTILLDEQAELAARLEIRGVPTNVLVDADGTVTEVGAATPDQLELATRRLLGPGAPMDPPTSRDWHWGRDPEEIERDIALRSSRARPEASPGGRGRAPRAASSGSAAAPSGASAARTSHKTPATEIT